MRGGDLNFRPFELAADFWRRFRHRQYQKRRMTGKAGKQTLSVSLLASLADVFDVNCTAVIGVVP